MAAGATASRELTKNAPAFYSQFDPPTRVPFNHSSSVGLSILTVFFLQPTNPTVRVIIAGRLTRIVLIAFYFITDARLIFQPALCCLTGLFLGLQLADWPEK